jgi:hypothetical protein
MARVVSGSTRAVLVVSERTSAAILGVVTGYLAMVTAAAWWGRRRRTLTDLEPRPPSRRYVVLIPAHDEERLIGSALDSLAQLDYPAELVGIHVVTDNCTDATASIARARGAEVHERVAPADGGKGPALQWLLERLCSRGEPHDAVVILDADTVVSPNLLTVIDAEMTAGAQAVQVYYAVRDADVSPITAFRAAALSVRHFLRPLGRTTLGGSCGLYGNGMAFAAPVLKSHRWTNHLTEDMELQLELLLQGTRVAFGRDARVEAEMPTTIAASRTQHERWERGRLELARRYVPRLVGGAVAGRGAGRIASIDASLDLLLPPVSVLVGATAVWSGIVLAAAVAHRRFGLPAGVAVAACTVQTAHVLSGLHMVSAPPTVYRGLLLAPRMVAWKVGLWSRMLRGREVAWIRTVRNSEDERIIGDRNCAGVSVRVG